ncbi:polysaccharide deacetylase family protein [Candidatus Daviesbacteria bacterium]|nr:polysaccharide deacetylase family protein [Candidatus Daviesbacteria bacterium]
MRRLIFLSLILSVVFLVFIWQLTASGMVQKAPPSTPTNTISTLAAQKTAPSLPPQTGRQSRVPILLYHYIGNNPIPSDKTRDALEVTPQKFDEQMGYLSQNGYTPITLDTMVAGLTGAISLPPKPVVITFDDGYVDLYHNAFKILQKYQFRAVAFIPTGLIGTSYYASWDMLSEMQSSGLLSFESHAVSHSNLTSLTNEQITRELSESKNTLQAKFGIPVNFLAYPYGASNGVVWESLKKTGYVGGLGTWSSNIQSEGTMYNMPRIKVSGSWTLPEFASRL